MLGLIIFIVVAGLVFLSVFGYYFWKIKTGDSIDLAKQFSGQFTADPTRESYDKSDLTDLDINNFIYSYTPILGSPDAPITIMAFIDFECQYCQESFPIFKKVMEQYQPIIKIVFKHLPVSGIHPNAMTAHLAAACTQEQNKFWEYYDLIFTNKKLDQASLLGYASELQLDLSQFANCLNSKKYAPGIRQDLIDSNIFGIRGTPTYIINKTKIEGVPTNEFWSKIILEKLKSN